MPKHFTPVTALCIERSTEVEEDNGRLCLPLLTDVLYQRRTQFLVLLVLTELPLDLPPF